MDLQGRGMGYFSNSFFFEATERMERSHHLLSLSMLMHYTTYLFKYIGHQFFDCLAGVATADIGNMTNFIKHLKWFVYLRM